MWKKKYIFNINKCQGFVVKNVNISKSLAKSKLSIARKYYSSRKCLSKAPWGNTSGKWIFVGNLWYYAFKPNFHIDIIDSRTVGRFTEIVLFLEKSFELIISTQKFKIGVLMFSGLNLIWESFHKLRWIAHLKNHLSFNFVTYLQFLTEFYNIISYWKRKRI